MQENTSLAQAKETLATVPWPTVGLVTLGLLIVWPIQYFVVAPVVTLGSWTLTGIKWLFVTVGAAALLLFLPIVGWVALAVIVVLRMNNASAERRHLETLAVQGAVIVEQAKRTPLWKQVWRPWMLSR